MGEPGDLRADELSLGLALDPAHAEAARPPLPAGMVTFVMTDIEGSTRLFRELGEGYANLLAAHRRLLRDAFRPRGGVEVGTEGDSVLVAFSDAAAALEACLAGQRSLAAHRWPDGGEIRVRIGVHTGQAIPVEGDYVALAVHQVARICAGAHGGQVLISAATVDNVAGRLPAGAALVALGSYQLRGFTTPEPLFQLEHISLRREFPPVRAIGVVSHNLPHMRAGFIGRDGERVDLAALLRSTGIVSVVGPPGVGKTRLAIQVAFDVKDDFPDGAWLVELATLTDPAAIPRAVAETLGIADDPGHNPQEQVLAALRSKTALMILDNCEHLLDGVAAFAERLTRQCPELVIFATSREPLDIEGEIVWRVHPLSTPDPTRLKSPSEATASDAVKLFLDRAEMIRPDIHLDEDNLTDVAAIVAHLNGIPLAIELAAAALAEQSVSGVLAGLDDRFSLLSHGRRTAPDRHQTLRAALEWSLDLLGPAERRLFARLSVFAGGGTTYAAAGVCSGEPVAAPEVPAMIRHLARASLLVVDPDDPGRWSMLESIRDLAHIELTLAGEEDAIAARLRSWYVEAVEEVGDLIGRRGRAAVMQDLAADADNLRRVIEGAVAAADADAALRIASALGPFWTSHGDWTEGSDHLRAALTVPGAKPSLRRRAQVTLGNLLLLRGDLEEAEALFAAAKTSLPASGDDVTRARALAGVGYIAFRRSQLGDARQRWEEALSAAERIGNERLIANILRSLAIASGSEGDQRRAQELLDRAIIAAEHAEDDQLLRLLLGSSAELHLWLGHYEASERFYGDALTLAGEIGDLSARPLLLAELGWIALLRGDPVTATRLSTDAAELAEDLGNRRVHAHAWRLHGEALTRTGKLEEAGAVLERALGVAEELGAPAEVAGVLCSQACRALDMEDHTTARRLAERAVELPSLAHPMRRTTPAWVLGAAALACRDLVTATAHFEEGLSLAERGGIPRHQANHLWGLAEVEVAGGRPGPAARLHGRSLALRRDLGDALGIAESLVGVAGVAGAVRPEQAARLVSAAQALRARAGAVPTAHEASLLSKAIGSRDGALAQPGRDDAGLSVDEAVGLAMETVHAIGERETGGNREDDDAATDGRT